MCACGASLIHLLKETRSSVDMAPRVTCGGVSTMLDQNTTIAPLLPNHKLSAQHAKTRCIQGGPEKNSGRRERLERPTTDYVPAWKRIWSRKAPLAGRRCQPADPWPKTAVRGSSAPRKVHSVSQHAPGMRERERVGLNRWKTEYVKFKVFLSIFSTTTLIFETTRYDENKHWSGDITRAT